MADRPTDEELRADLEDLVLQQQLVASVQQITGALRKLADTAATAAKQLELARVQQARLDQLERRVQWLTEVRCSGGHG